MKFLKSTGITRKIDELGRIVIPKEIRRNLGIRDGESLEIFTDEDGIILKKHSQIEKYEEMGSKLCELISSVFLVDVIITDREKVIATSKDDRIVNKMLSKELLYLIDNREELIEQGNVELEDISLKGYFTIVPIIASIDSLGLIIISANSDKDYRDLARLIRDRRWYRGYLLVLSLWFLFFWSEVYEKIRKS